MKCLFKIVLIVLVVQTGFAQNGRLLHKENVKLPDSIRQKIDMREDFKNIFTKTELFKITYESDGLKINGYLSTPKESGSYPVLIFNRGGNRDFGALNDINATYILRTMAEWGYIVVASNYRGGGGSGGMEEFGGKDVNDIHNLLPFINNLKEADTSRIGIYGWSRGGLMTYRAISESCKFKAAIIGAGVANSFRNIEERPEMEKYVFSQLLPDYKTNKEAELKKRSAIYWTDKLCKTTPILLLHGSGDWRVSPKDALDMADSLYAKKHPFRLHFYEGGDHGINEYRQTVRKNVRDFLDYYVKDLKTHPNMEPHGR